MSDESPIRAKMNPDRALRLYEAVLSNTPDLVYVFDVNHRFTYANEALLRMWGKTWDEAIGKNCLELGYEPWHAAMHDREIEQVIATKKAVRGEVPFTGTNGRRIYDYIFVPVIGPNGDVEAIAGTTRDVTERKLDEEKLAQQARLLDLSSDAIIVRSLENRILFWNHGAERLYGWKAEEVLGKDLQKLLKIRFPKLLSEINQELSQNGNWSGELVVTAQLGQRVPVLCRKTLDRDEQGNPVAVLESHTDITHRKKSEEAIVAGRLLQVQDEERRRIARELHDSAGQTLAALSMNLMPLERDGMPPSAAKMIKESLDLIATLSRELRTISHLLHPPLLDEVGLASALRAFIDGFNERSKIKVSLEIPDDFPRLPQDVETAIFRIVQEALTNVHRHSGSPVAKVRIAPAETQILVEIVDEGKGIAVEKQKAMDSGTRLGVGIRGMGERVRQLGGTLNITFGRHGTIVAVTFPIDRESSMLGTGTDLQLWVRN